MSYLSEEDQKALSSFNNQSLEYQIAQLHYYQRYVSSNKKTSNEYISQQLSSHNPSYQIAWGNDEFTPTGELKDYEVTDQLKQIKVPTLILSGTDDESTPLINKTIYDNLGGYKEWILTPNSNHSSFINNQKYIEKLKNINTIIVETKNDEGSVLYASDVCKDYLSDPSQATNNAMISKKDLTKIIKEYKKNGFYCVSRIVTFKDAVFAMENPKESLTDHNGNLVVYNDQYWPSA